MSFLKKNCCDGVYNSIDVHFTQACDNNCAHCVDMRFSGKGMIKPLPYKIVGTILQNCDGVDDVLFLGGEPCLWLDELLACVRMLRATTDLKLFVTTAVPKTCYDERDKFEELLELLDGINLSVQHYNEQIADKIRRTTSLYDRQSFYNSLPNKEKIRINLNIVKPYLHTHEELVACLRHYDFMGFNSIKLSEIQHGTDVFVSFSDIFDLKMKSAYAHGCQTYLDTSVIIPDMQTPLLLKRSCFLCEETLKASPLDILKLSAQLFSKKTNKYGVVYSDGSLERGWV